MYVSKCCDAPITVDGIRGSTRYYTCRKCNKPCDAYFIYDTAFPGDFIGTAKVDVVNHPAHYTAHPSGVECIQITEWMNFCRGNAIKYIWRAGLKGNKAIEDLKKAEFYIKREIARLEKEESNGQKSDC